MQIKCQHLPEEINSRTVGQPSYHHPAGCQGKLIMKESSSVSRTWDLQRQQEKGTLKNTVGPSWGFSGMWGWGGGYGGGRHVERTPDYGRALPSLPEGRQVPGWKKAGNLVPYLVLKRAGPALRKACVCLPVLIPLTRTGHPASNLDEALPCTHPPYSSALRKAEAPRP